MRETENERLSLPPRGPGLVLALVAGEYCCLAVTSGRSSTWLATYLCLFLVGISVHGRKAKETP